MPCYTTRFAYCHTLPSHVGITAHPYYLRGGNSEVIFTEGLLGIGLHQPDSLFPLTQRYSLRHRFFGFSSYIIPMSFIFVKGRAKKLCFFS